MTSPVSFHGFFGKASSRLLTSSILFLILLLLFYNSPTAICISPTTATIPRLTLPPPIVYTIAGSDSGGGAGIQADLHAMHSMGVHGCCAITCLTAQSSMGVTGVHSPPIEFLKLQLDTLVEDMPPRAIKIGMLGSKELAMQVGQFLKDLRNKYDNSSSHSSNGSDNDVDDERPSVVLDPVMISTSGHKLIQDDAKAAIVEYIFPFVDIVTPNKFEAEELLGRSLNSFQDIEMGAKEILDMGVKSVLIKGGHSFADKDNHENHNKYAQDYFLSKEPPLDKDGKQRLCDGCRGVWLRTNRYDSIHTHGTGCTLSSVIASALAIGHQQRSFVGRGGGDGVGTRAATSIYMTDACVLAKAYITAGVARGVPIGQGPGPVVHTAFPSQKEYFPSIVLDPRIDDDDGYGFGDGLEEGFLRMKRATASTALSEKQEPVLGKLLPIVDNVDWLERLVKLEEITDIQLRIKGETDQGKIFDLVQQCQNLCESHGVRLWINDYWRAAINAKCFGVHLGQEDLARCVDEGGLEEMKSNGLALGISTHSYAELSAALGIKPSYISLGPVFGTKSKNVAFDPQGLETVRKWRDLIGFDTPLVAIGGINDVGRTKQVKCSGADCVAVIGAVQKEDIATAVKQLEEAMS